MLRKAVWLRQRFGTKYWYIIYFKFWTNMKLSLLLKWGEGSTNWIYLLKIFCNYEEDQTPIYSPLEQKVNWLRCEELSEWNGGN